MFSLTVRDHAFIAHSLRGEIFGPARNLHGATLVIDAEFRKTALDQDNVVIDIGLASRLLKAVTATIDYRNLDTIEEFLGLNTTTEYLARHIHDELKKRLGNTFSGTLKITVHESPSAWASYEEN